jgi:hypothetical protein
VHIRDVAKKLTRVLKIGCYNPRKWLETDVFAKTNKPFCPGDIPLMLLCIKLWSVRGGGTVRVMKCIILASVWARNSRFQRHLNGPKKATKTSTLGSKKKSKPRQMSCRRSLCTSGMLQKIDPSPENRAL